MQSHVRILAASLIAALGVLPLGCARSNSSGQAASEASAEATAQEQGASQTDAAERPTVDGTLSVDREEPATEVARAESADPPALEVPTEPEPENKTPATSKTKLPAPLPASQAPLPYDLIETANLKMPPVVLSDQHAALCKIRVGDQFPNLELPNLEGEKRTLTELFGPKLTLVVFWNARQPNGLEELSDLNRYHLPRFGDKGLAVVAINSGDQSQLASEMANHAGAGYPVLSDADGAALSQVASGKLPRTYLLDPSGKVVWFDLEYSATTRRDLAAAIRVSLGQ